MEWSPHPYPSPSKFYRSLVEDVIERLGKRETLVQFPLFPMEVDHGLNHVPPKGVKVLTPHIYECAFIWKWGLYKWSSNTKSLGCIIIQYDRFLIIIFFKDRTLDIEPETQGDWKSPCEDWSFVATSQWTPKISTKPLAARREAWNKFSITSSGGTNPANTFILDI